MENNTNKKQVRLLADVPTSTDVFGSHLPIAETIVDIVENEDGGKTIGLEGGWGSGKSTVIKLLTEKIKDKKNIKIFNFDAWVHEGDPLRRSFLESLITKLINVKWINSKVWNEKKDELSNRKKTVEKKNGTTFTIFGALLAISMLLVPFGIAMMFGGFRNNESQELLIIGEWLALSPVIILIVNYLLLGLSYFNTSKVNVFIFGLFIVSAISYYYEILPRNLFIGTIVTLACLSILKMVTHRFYNSSKNKHLLSLISQNETDTTITSRTETPDPTSIEFSGIFDEVLRDALNKNKNRRLIIVVDNLDRISKDDARSIWSSLRTFLEYGELRTESFIDRLWVIVPYDKNGMFESTSPHEEKVSASFLDKVFQTRFYVSPPVLSDWKIFLLSLLYKAFPEHKKEDEQFHLIYRVHAICFKTEHPTPRSLIQYVNDVGSLYRIWGEEIPLSHLGYFSILRRKEEDFKESLEQGDIPEKEFIKVLGDELQTNIAALYFNAPKERALQILLKDKIINALEYSNDKLLSEMSDIYPSFSVVIEHELKNIIDVWQNQESYKIANAAYALSESKILLHATESEKNSIVNIFIDKIDVIEYWGQFSHATGIGIASIIGFKPDHRTGSKIISSLKRTLTFLAGLSARTEYTIEWIDGLITVLEALDEYDLIPKDLIFELPLGDTEPFKSESAIVKRNRSGKFWGNILPVSTLYNNDVIPATITAGNIHEDIEDAIIYDLKTHKNIDIDHISTSIIERLTSNQISIPVEISYLYSLLSKLDDEKERDSLITLGGNGVSLNNLHLSSTVGSESAIAWSLYSYLLSKTDVSVTPVHGNSQAGYNYIVNNLFTNPDQYIEVVKCFVDIIVDKNRYKLLFDILDASPNAEKWVVNCIIHLDEIGKVFELLSKEEIFERWEFLENNIKKAPEDSYLEELIGVSQDLELIEYIISREFDKEYAGLYSAMLEHTQDKKSDIKKWLEEGCKKISKDDWLVDFISYGQLSKFIFKAVENDYMFSVYLDYFDALVEYAEKVASNEIAVEYSYDAWQDFIGLLSKAQLENYRGKIRDIAEESRGDIYKEFFDLFGDDIANDPETIKDRKLVSNLFIPLLTTSNIDGLKWIMISLTKNNFLKKYVVKPQVDEFIERLKSIIDSDDGTGSELTSVVKSIHDILVK